MKKNDDRERIVDVGRAPDRDPAELDGEHQQKQRRQHEARHGGKER